MQIDWWTIGFQAVNGLVLIWILARFLFRPVAGMIAARKADIAARLEAVAAREAEAETARADARAEQARTAAARTAILRAAAAEAEGLRAGILSDARAEATRQQETARAALARETAEAEASRARAARLLALDIATRLLDRLPPSARVAGFVDGLCAGVAALPAPERAGLGRGGALPLSAARALDPEETAACAAALGRVLGRPVTLEVAADPGLIAGFELALPHARVRNSFRADLDRIATELTRHDD
ncbi:hypothetical protein FDP22_19155 (plasmid) [Paroceanicella profunda]|uniref:ATP synthase subunit b n=1 Tax=Paroceanicella profunda TaxID=2579971 RepID=A0A5B8G4T2_9RHOB|nr:hypothetical protein [Paroceanicella profunda]QDL93993.1 hypothetical protein FDP22_19155 [Paroceanicella profunda]